MKKLTGANEISHTLAYTSNNASQFLYGILRMKCNHISLNIVCCKLTLLFNTPKTEVLNYIGNDFNKNFPEVYCNRYITNPFVLDEK